MLALLVLADMACKSPMQDAVRSDHVLRVLESVQGGHPPGSRRWAQRSTRLCKHLRSLLSHRLACEVLQVVMESLRDGDAAGNSSVLLGLLGGARSLVAPLAVGWHSWVPEFRKSVLFHVKRLGSQGLDFLRSVERRWPRG